MCIQKLDVLIRVEPKHVCIITTHSRDVPGKACLNSHCCHDLDFSICFYNEYVLTTNIIVFNKNMLAVYRAQWSVYFGLCAACEEASCLWNLFSLPTMPTYFCLSFSELAITACPFCLSRLALHLLTPLMIFAGQFSTPGIA